ncbi:MAG: hypothetical protein A2W61_06870 [Deltaproteobacteria bacterium RIFCSPLOWO2_01_44_7]|nr:MAG: hypothetical protein A2712_01130 [Deltaproteobacteria bacterium RIFCSPHIGHO2_01_FULL_43_49]OGQ15260.1 MAG: hypothetical protein A3D22_04345 [Deltaproteobacteria bacterium RIFCSPHIGHO2_02_FULL_44_53]OGQ27116.1 MAG: hypothetical protein A3D98_01720 [Deltaproteobacteria bacterium RIFCSPHIGHO2_12_FULL_44_21]OGQ31776.1 MAG: hypothetical protein A2979_05505 [Deltaproteobacteria bacterium RIFCSPLOWO2_01_FULL_45_74]OGQ42978.1 MAG: hypothetical protein A3I70_07810 [Deltaproteobacteria bacterium 
MYGFGHSGFYSFEPHIAVFLGLMALGFGYWIFIQAKSDTSCSKLGKFFGVLISIVAALGLICILYLSIKRCCMAPKGDWYKSHMQMMAPPDENHPGK